MEPKKADVEQAFTECKKSHDSVMRLNKILMLIAPPAIVLCAALGVWYAVQDKFFMSFFEFFLCLFDAKLLHRAFKRHDEETREWIVMEARHKFIMEHWDEIEAHHEEMRRLQDEQSMA